MKTLFPAVALTVAAFALPIEGAQAADAFASCLAQLRAPAAKAGVSGATFDTVSYTHLTLPTICSV